MIKQNKCWKYLPVFLCAFFALGAAVAPTTPAEKLEKGIELYENHQDEEALDYFVDVMINGTRDEMNTANKYLNLMHDRLGGIQSPIEAGGKAKAGSAAEGQEGAWYEQESQHQALTDWVEDQHAAAREGQAAEGEIEEQPLTETDVLAVGMEDENLDAFDETTEYKLDESATGEGVTSTYVDLTSPQAIEARELYTSQKLASMTQAVIDRLNATPGVHLYMRGDKPDAIDLEPNVVFDRNKFRADAQPLLNDVYELLALTQGSAYVILPEGSYTDDVTLPRMRQAMALNSYLVNRGISQGKVHYNMGLVDEEPPARFANLNGLSIVFDYDQKLPTVLENNENNEKLPLLSMAIVPLCHVLDRSVGDAFAVDFSVLETVNPLNNWVLQVVQHGHDGKFYIVRQLEGFGPVYHQILWNGRKGIIGPELPCGKYTFVLVGTDVKGNKQTLRRRVIVKCTDQEQTSAACQKACSDCEKTCRATTAVTSELDYKAARLWKKPKRKMGGTVKKAAVVATEQATAVQQQDAVSTTTKTVTETTIVQEYDPAEEAALTQGKSAQGTTTTTQTTSTTESYGTTDDSLLMNNPYGEPLDSF